MNSKIFFQKLKNVENNVKKKLKCLKKIFEKIGKNWKKLKKNTPINLVYHEWNPWHFDFSVFGKKGSQKMLLSEPSR